MSWIYLAILAPFLFAIVNLFDDNLLNFIYESPYIATISVGFYGSLPLLSRIFIHSNFLPNKLIFLATLAGFLTLTYYFYYFKALKIETPSVVVALIGLSPATIPFIAHFLVNERLNLAEIIGLTLVIFGSTLLVLKKEEKLNISKVFAPIIAVVLFMDFASIALKFVYQRSDFYSAYLYFSLGMLIGAVFYLLINFQNNKTQIKKISNNIKKLLPVLILAELIGLSAELTLNLAIKNGPVSLVKAIENIQPLFVLIIAIIFYPKYPKYFREAKSGYLIKKFSSIFLVITGIIFIVVSSEFN